MSTSPLNFKRVLAVALKPGSAPTKETFPELGQVLVLMRLAFAVVLAAFFAAAGVSVETALPIAGSSLLLVGVVFVKVWLKAKEETYDATIIFEGLGPAVAMLVLAWSVLLTLGSGGAGSAAAPAPASA